MSYSEKSKSLCFESIYVKNGKAPLLDFHCERVNRTLSDLYHKRSSQFRIKIPDFKWEEDLVYKLRFIYNAEMHSYQIIPYLKKNITQAKIVVNYEIEYGYKYYDRTDLKSLLPDNNDSEIIIVKNDCITDSSYSNLVFRKDAEFFTPTYPLLKGTQRAYLLSIKKIQEKTIRIDDLKNYDECYFINALNSLESCNHISVSQISTDISL